MPTRSFIMLIVAVLCLGLIGLWYGQSSRKYTLLVAAGQRSSQAFQLAEVRLDLRPSSQ